MATGETARPTLLLFSFDERMFLSPLTPFHSLSLPVSPSLSVTVSLSTLFWTRESPSGHLFQWTLKEVDGEGSGCRVGWEWHIYATWQLPPCTGGGVAADGLLFCFFISCAPPPPLNISYWWWSLLNAFQLLLLPLAGGWVGVWDGVGVHCFGYCGWTKDRWINKTWRSWPWHPCMLHHSRHLCLLVCVSISIAVGPVQVSKWAMVACCRRCYDLFCQ